ncbi:MAG TPA: HutD family protein [Thermomicrobiales bacterium]|nr:HutD family protein [Thermomicrobiales bacterium]
MRRNELTVIPWKNGAGSAIDLHVVPEGAGWDDFRWRANIAWFDRDVPFSSYPGVERQLLVLEGRFTIVVDGVSTALSPDSGVFSFAGNATTRVCDVEGPVRVFNVLARLHHPATSVRVSTGRMFLGREPDAGVPELLHVVTGTAAARYLDQDPPVAVTLDTGDVLIGDGHPIEVRVADESRTIVATTGPDPGNRPLLSRPRVIAHRGASGYAPENTRSAFDLAVAMGADAIETDVRLSADGVPVLVHDATVDRTSDGMGPVSSLTLAQLDRLDFGSRFGHGWAGERVVTLDQLLAGYGQRIPLVIEIKEMPAVEPAMARLRATAARWEVTSFDWESIVAARAMVPGGRFGFLARGFDDATIGRCVAAGLDQICPPAPMLTADRVRAAKRAGLEVRAHGVKSRADVARLFASDVDGATINWPDWMRDVLPDTPTGPDGRTRARAN